MSTIALALLRLLVLSSTLQPPDPVSPAWAKGLPAVSEDGKWVAVAVVVADVARANENLTLAIFDVAHDRVAESVVVVDANDPEAPGRAPRDARAVALLAKRAWRPLHALAVDEDVDEDNVPSSDGGGDVSKHCGGAVGDDLYVRYCEPKLSVREGSARGRRLLERVERRFSKRGGARCKGCEDCPKPTAGMTIAYADRAARVLLLVVDYWGGNDTCWEPDRGYHVVRFGR
jgi:hypothetical protein